MSSRVVGARDATVDQAADRRGKRWHGGKPKLLAWLPDSCIQSMDVV